MPNASIILASASPRRRILLESAGLHIDIQAQNIDESPLPGESVRNLVQRLAKSKAFACKASDAIIIAADTLVCLGETIFGQPKDQAHARQMLQALSAQSHQVLTAVCLRRADKSLTACISTTVRFRQLSNDEIDRYLLHNHVLDKAGAYAAQEGAACFIEGIDGPLDNVIGLPVHQTLSLMTQLEPQ